LCVNELKNRIQGATSITLNLDPHLENKGIPQ
jgi:hypothetical protein